MLLTTTNQLESKRVVEYRGIVTGEVIAGVNIVRDFFAGFRDVFGGRSVAYEKELTNAREKALQEMQERAEALGANAVIGIDIDYESLSGGGMLMVSASGTAVIVE